MRLEACREVVAVVPSLVRELVSGVSVERQRELSERVQALCADADHELGALDVVHDGRMERLVKQVDRLVGVVTALRGQLEGGARSGRLPEPRDTGNPQPKDGWRDKSSWGRGLRRER